MHPGPNVIPLVDYSIRPEELDSVTVSEGLVIEAFDGAELTLSQTKLAKGMESVKMWKGGNASVIPIRKSLMEELAFTFDPHGKAYSSVQIKGEMNAWNVNANTLTLDENGVYVTKFVLSPGKYQYKMVLDGKEASHSDNPDSVSNGLGGYNQVLKVGEEEDAAIFVTASLKHGQLIVTGRTDDRKITALWNNTELKTSFSEGAWVLHVPENASVVKRSFVRVWVSDSQHVSNDILIPLDFGKPLSDVKELERMDKHAMTLYNVFIDRFSNGNKANDHMEDPELVLPKANSMGGDLQGLIEKVDEGFFEERGINTIWISPVVKNVDGPYGYWPEPESRFSPYHGYWPVSFTLVEPRFGTPADLHELVDKAHSRNLNVLLDFVANHVHEEHPYYKAHPEVATDLYLPDGTLNTERWDDHRLTTWFDVFMPSLQLDKPEVYEMMTDSAIFWIKEYDFDGFRHDATKHVPEIFWRTLTRKLKEQVISTGKPLYQIGETYGSRELVGSYVNTGQLDAQFDFNIYDSSVGVLVSEGASFEDFSTSVHASLEAFGHHHLMGNITGNQDRARFISYAGGALRLDEDAKVAGWTREVGVGDTVSYNKSEMLMSLVTTLPGLPVIYYGDEYGSYGGNDPDNRKMMQFEGYGPKETELLSIYKQLMNLRRTSLPLIYGDFREHVIKDQQYVYSRNYLGSTVVVLINNSKEEVELNFSLDPDQAKLAQTTWLGAPINSKGNTEYTLTLAPYSFEIIK
jgi:glycosidase